MSTTRLERTSSTNKVEDENASAPKLSRSVTRQRPASASGLRSKIPTIINQNTPGPSMADPQVSLIIPQDTRASVSHGKSNRRLNARSINSSLSRSKGSLANSSAQKLLEKQFKNKQNRYLTMRSEIEEKQRNASDIYEEMSGLRKKLIATGLKDPGHIEGIKLIPDNSNKCSENDNPLRGSGTFINKSVTSEFASILENELRDYPKECVNLCEHIIEKHSEFVEWINNKCQDKIDDPEILGQFVECKMEVKSMKIKLEETKKKLDDLNGELIRKVIIMWEEIEGSRLRIRDLETMSDEVVNNLRIRLDIEVEKFNQLKEQKTLSDNELRKANTRIQKLEETIEANDKTVSKYQEYIKSLDIQIKQNDANYERATRDLHKSLENSEEIIISLESQRDNLESRLIEMKGKLDQFNRDDIQKEVDNLNQELVKYKDMVNKVSVEKLSVEEDLKSKLQNEKMTVLKLTEDYNRLQNENDVMQNKIRDLEDKLVSINSRSPPKVQLLSSTEYINPSGDYQQEILLYQRKNMDLETNLNFVKSQLQQKDQTLRDQYQRIQVQDELINYFKNSGKNPSGRLNLDAQEINKELADKSEAIKSLSEKLESKEQQLGRLEKFVKQLEDQDDRAQEQRTRLERRIAQLEIELQAKNNKDCGRKRISILQGFS